MIFCAEEVGVASVLLQCVLSEHSKQSIQIEHSHSAFR